MPYTSCMSFSLPARTEVFHLSSVGGLIGNGICDVQHGALTRMPSSGFTQPFGYDANNDGPLLADNSLTTNPAVPSNLHSGVGGPRGPP